MTTRVIYFWPDATWCESDELETMLHHRSDDFGTMRITEDAEDDDIDTAVRVLVSS